MYGYHKSIWWSGRRAVLLYTFEPLGRPPVPIGSSVTMVPKDPATADGFVVKYQDAPLFSIPCEELSLL